MIDLLLAHATGWAPFSILIILVVSFTAGHVIGHARGERLGRGAGYCQGFWEAFDRMNAEKE